MFGGGAGEGGQVEADLAWVVAGRVVPELDQGRLDRQPGGGHLVDADRELPAAAAQRNAQGFCSQASGDLGEVDQVPGDHGHAGITPTPGGALVAPVLTGPVKFFV